MLPLALIVQGHAAMTSRARTARSTPAAPPRSSTSCKARGIGLHPQDGSGVTRKEQLLVTSAAVEDTVPDVVAAKQLGCPQVTRPQLLAQLVNSAKVSIAVGGTSGKSTTTGMIGWILYATRRDPTVMNGAVMKNFVAGDFPFASAIVGEGDIFVSEVDESDGSIALYNPTIAVLNNIALDHKSMDELRRLFTDFVTKAQVAVLNLDNDETRRLAEQLKLPDALTYSLTRRHRRLLDLRPRHAARRPVLHRHREIDRRAPAHLPADARPPQPLQRPRRHRRRPRLRPLPARSHHGADELRRHPPPP